MHQAKSHSGLVLLFTYGTPLTTWAKTGFILREVTYYQKIAKQFGPVSWLTYGGGEDTDLARNLGITDIRILNNRWGYSPWRFAWQGIWHYRRELSNACIIKTNQLAGAWVGIWGKLLSGTKLVVRAGFIPSRNKAKKGISRQKLRRLRFLEQSAFLFADRILLPTSNEVDYVTSHYQVDASKIVILPNFVDTDSFRPDEFVQPLFGSISYVGNLTSNKNVCALIGAVAGLSGVSLRIIGSGPERNSLENRARHLGIQVEFLGNLPNDQLPPCLRESQVFAFPSLFEGHPKALLEAMACGLSVVTTPVDGIRNLVSHGDTGFICSGTDALSIRQGLQTVLSDSDMRRRLGRNARDFVVENFRTEKILDRELEVYRELDSRC